MVYRVAVAALLAGFSTQVLAANIPTCNPSQPCPSDTPCCSAYGQCGVGAYCLAGCDPRSSASLDSCVARPVCKSGSYQFSNLDDFEANTKYLGNDSSINWISEGTPAEYAADGSVLLTMAEGTVGTLLTSTFEVWYGKISCTMKTSAGQGVVSAFIMMSDVKDEIDFEFVGADLQHAQSNYYWQGDPIYTNEKNLTAANTNTEFHTYEIDWNPSSITWSVDGTAMRTLQASDTVNSSTGIQNFPQTPARIMISLWPAGISSNSPGTINWAGGLIDWHSQYMQNGYYYAEIKEVTVECYNPPSGAKEDGTQSYMYTSKDGLQSDVEITNNSTSLASFYASGSNPDYNPNAQSSAGSNPTASGSGSVPVPSNAQTVPGDVGTGQRGGDGSSEHGSGTSGGASPSSTAGGNSFNQNNMATGGKTEKAMHGSAVAVIIALVALVML